MCVWRPLNEAVARGKGDRRRPVAGPRSIEDVREVVTHRPLTQAQQRRDLPVGAPRRDQAQYLDLSRGQPPRRGRASIARAARLLRQRV